MIIKEYCGNVYNSDLKLYMYYSDQQLQIQQVETGIVYDCAIDLETMHYTYIETNSPRTDIEKEVN